MTTTRGSALAHIVNELLGAAGNADHPAALFATKCGFTGPSELMMVEPEELDSIELKDSNGVVVDIPLGLKKRIIAMEYVFKNRAPADRVLDLWVTLDPSTYEAEMIADPWSPPAPAAVTPAPAPHFST